MRLFALLLLLVVGCSGDKPTTHKTVYDGWPREFPNAPASKRLTFDLAGVWGITKLGGTLEEERWEAKWILKPTPQDQQPIINDSFGCWDDSNGQGRFVVCHGKNLDVLIWFQKTDNKEFAIEVKGFGFLMLHDKDQRQYLAVRSD